MKISDLIEEYIKNIIADEESVELSRSELASKFNCVPSQINYVISTRFIPELGFYVESRRGGGGYIRINKVDLSNSNCLSEIISKIGRKMSQSVVDIYLKEFIRYNVITVREAKLIKIAVSDKSLNQVETSKRDFVRADIFKHLIINLI